MKCEHGLYCPSGLNFAPNCPVCWEFPKGYSIAHPFQLQKDKTLKFMGMPSTHGFTKIQQPSIAHINAGEPHHYDAVDFTKWLYRKMGIPYDGLS